MTVCDDKNDDDNNAVTVTTEVRTILQWPSDTFSIDHVKAASAQNDHRAQPSSPIVHTVIVFIPGNPGLIGWYIPFFTQMLERLGPGFACRGVALAGHSLDAKVVDVEQYKRDNTSTNRHLMRETAIPWTVDGQVQHKCAYMDLLLEEFDKGHFCPGAIHDDNDSGKIKSDLDLPRFIFVSHSIGAHFTQRLCILRPDILQRTRHLIHLMPFIRMDAAPRRMQTWLNTCARSPEAAIAIVQATLAAACNNNNSTFLPRWSTLLDKMLSLAMNDNDGRAIAVRLLQIPAFVRNFGMLGFEEIRDVPQVFDVSNKDT
jgi:pimeloyl-ACP methyl ester carboxylesterase